MLNFDLNETWIYPFIAGLLVTAIGIAVPKFLAKVQGKEPPDPAEIATAAFSNAVNFPIPIIYAIAPEGLGVAAIFIAVSIIMRNTVGFWISGYKMNLDSLKKIALFPPIWGVILGIVLNFYGAETVFAKFADTSFGNLLFDIGIFMTLMTVGFGLSNFKIGHKDSLMRVGLTRFVISFGIGLVVAIILGLPKYVAIPVIIQMGAPPAVYNGLYAEKFNMNTELTSDVIIVLTTIALIVLPLELVGLLILFP